MISARRSTRWTPSPGERRADPPRRAQRGAMRTDDPPLDGTLKWRYAVRHEPHDVRLERTRRLLDELRSAAAADGQHYYWAD